MATKYSLSEEGLEKFEEVIEPGSGELVWKGVVAGLFGWVLALIIFNVGRAIL